MMGRTLGRSQRAAHTDDSCHPPLSSALTFRSLFSSPSLERLCLQLVFTRFCLPRQTARRCPALHIATEDPSSSSSPRLCDSLRIKNIPCALSMFDVTRFLSEGVIIRRLHSVAQAIIAKRRNACKRTLRNRGVSQSRLWGEYYLVPL